MNANECNQCAETIFATAEILGHELKPMSVRLMVKDLRQYPASEVDHALSRCRSELKGKLSLQAIIERIPSINSFPSPNEAWGIALSAQDEYDTIIWIDEIAEASGAAKPILDAGDKVGARMAFIECYQRLVDQAKTEGRSPEWTASLGSDKLRREEAISEGIRKGLLTQQHADIMLPPPPPEEETEESREKSRKVIQMLRDLLDGDDDSREEERQRQREAHENRRQEVVAQAEELISKRAQA